MLDGISSFFFDKEKQSSEGKVTITLESMIEFVCIILALIAVSRTLSEFPAIKFPVDMLINLWLVNLMYRLIMTWNGATLFFIFFALVALIKYIGA